MLNFLYCLDSNYNKQFLTSLQSLLDNLSEKVNCFVIHKDSGSLEDLINEIDFKHEKINKFQVYNYVEKINNFPNLGNNHVSEATYFRFFLDNYLEETIDNIVYLDCDIICFNNPEKILKELIKKLVKSDYIIGASTEYINTNKLSEVFNRLELKNHLYFNAGVMLIDLQKWKMANVQRSLIEIMNKKYERIVFWDQDIMNCYFDGQYLEISRYLNFKDYELNTKGNIIDQRSIIFLHYAGSKKPWTIPGSVTNSAKFFHTAYQKVFKIKYLLKNNYRKQALKDLLKVIFTLKFAKLQFPFEFVRLSLKTLKK